jgi:hypothetical protein
VKEPDWSAFAVPWLRGVPCGFADRVVAAVAKNVCASVVEIAACAFDTLAPAVAKS